MPPKRRAAAAARAAVASSPAVNRRSSTRVATTRSQQATQPAPSSSTDAEEEEEEQDEQDASTSHNEGHSEADLEEAQEDTNIDDNDDPTLAPIESRGNDEPQEEDEATEDQLVAPPTTRRRGRGRATTRSRGSMRTRGRPRLTEIDTNQATDEDRDDQEDDLDADSGATPGPTDGSPAPTTTTRGRGRGRGRPSGWRGGTRGRGRGGPKGPSHVTRAPIDKEGNIMRIDNDEVVLPEDTEGEEKIDKSGRLLGGRDYRVRTFTILDRGDRLYMLSTEPARCTGFRDSYLFFAKHERLFKIIIDDNEKKDLIERGLIPHSYKGRPIGVVTARSVFREFGAKIVVGGKKVVDDYYVQQARDRGDVEGDLADPHDSAAPGGGGDGGHGFGLDGYDRNRYVAWHGASDVYRQITGTPGQGINLPPGYEKYRPQGRKSTAVGGPHGVNDVNWMLKHSMAAAEFNRRLVEERRKTLGGVYDPHTNLTLYPSIMQPTIARWERVCLKRKRIAGNTEALERSHKSIFASVPEIVNRNYLVVDTIMETPSNTSLIPPGSTAALLHLNPYLSHEVDKDRDLLPLLPDDGRFEDINGQQAGDSEVVEPHGDFPSSRNEALVGRESAEGPNAHIKEEYRAKLEIAKGRERAWLRRWDEPNRNRHKGVLRIGVGLSW